MTSTKSFSKVETFRCHPMQSFLRVIVCLRSGAERLLRCRRTAVPKISCKWLTFITRYVFICTYQKLKIILHLIKQCKLQRLHWSFIGNYKMRNEPWHFMEALVIIICLLWKLFLQWNKNIKEISTFFLTIWVYISQFRLFSCSCVVDGNLQLTSCNSAFVLRNSELWSSEFWEEKHELWE